MASNEALRDQFEEAFRRVMFPALPDFRRYCLAKTEYSCPSTQGAWWGYNEAQQLPASAYDVEGLLLAALKRTVDYHVPGVNPLSDAANLSAMHTIANFGEGAPAQAEQVPGASAPFMWVRVENDCIEDYTQDKWLAESWMQVERPVTFPLYTAPAQDVAGLVEALKEASQYLDSSNLNSIAAGSTCHRKMHAALAAYKEGAV